MARGPTPGRSVGGLVAGAIMLVVVLWLATQVGALAGGGAGADGAANTSTGVVAGSTSIPTDGTDLESVVSVRTSLNDSVRLSGAADSNVTIDSPAELGHDLSVCTYAALNGSVVTNDETGLLLATQPAILWYNGSTDTWEGYFYNTSSRNSFRASVAASSPQTPTLVCLNHADQSLNLTANTTAGSAVATGSSNIADYPENVSNWHGRVEETRLYATPLNGSQRSEWVADPVLAVAGPAPATRVTYDTPLQTLPSTLPVYFSSGEATVSNASLAAGRGGPAITSGTDYSISGGTLTVLDGGLLEPTGEVLYFELLVSGLVGPVLGSIGDGVALASIALIVGAGVIIFRSLSKSDRRR